VKKGTGYFLAQSLKIVDDLEAALEQFRLIAEDLGGGKVIIKKGV
jgi:hypothetical protein